MRENRPYGSEGGAGESPSRPLSDQTNARWYYAMTIEALANTSEDEFLAPRHLIQNCPCRGLAPRGSRSADRPKMTIGIFYPCRFSARARAGTGVAAMDLS
jgi:hypothetical protein